MYYHNLRIAKIELTELIGNNKEIDAQIRSKLSHLSAQLAIYESIIFHESSYYATDTKCEEQYSHINQLITELRELTTNFPDIAQILDHIQLAIDPNYLQASRAAGFGFFKSDRTPDRLRIKHEELTNPRETYYLVGHGKLNKEGDNVLLRNGNSVTFYSGIGGILIETITKNVLEDNFNSSMIKVATMKYTAEAPDLFTPSYARFFPQKAYSNSDIEVQVTVPDYTLHPPKTGELQDFIATAAKTGKKLLYVDKPTKLSKILSQYENCDLHWMACTGSPEKSLSSDVSARCWY